MIAWGFLLYPLYMRTIAFMVHNHDIGELYRLRNNSELYLFYELILNRQYLVFEICI